MNWVKGMLSSSPETHPLLKRLEKDGPNARMEKGGNTLLEEAILDRDVPLWVIQQLLRRGANRDAFRPYSTVVHDVVFHQRRDDKTTRELVRMLVQDHEFDPNAEDSHGRTPLYYALIGLKLSIAKDLIRLGADRFHPALDSILNNPELRTAPAFLRKARNFRSASEAAQKEFLMKEAITQHAEATSLGDPDDPYRKMTGIPPGVPGPDIVKQFLTKKGGRKSTTRHRKTRRRHRRR